MTDDERQIQTVAEEILSEIQRSTALADWAVQSARLAATTPSTDR